MPWVVPITMYVDVVQRNDCDLFKPLRRRSRYGKLHIKVFLQSNFSPPVSLFSLSLSPTHILSLPHSLLYPLHNPPPHLSPPIGRQTFALRKHRTRHHGNGRAQSTNAIRPRKHQYVQVTRLYVPSWYKNYTSPKVCAVYYTLFGFQFTCIEQ